MQTMKTTIVVITTIAHRPIDPTTIADIGAVKNTGIVELWTTEPANNISSSFSCYCKLKIPLSSQSFNKTINRFHQITLIVMNRGEGKICMLYNTWIVLSLVFTYVKGQRSQDVIFITHLYRKDNVGYLTSLTEGYHQSQITAWTATDWILARFIADTLVTQIIVKRELR